MSPRNAAVVTSGGPDKTETGQIKISGGLIARNTLLNLIGQAAPLLVGILTIPYVVHGLGTERFGILSLAWVILGYFAIFDLGLGRATTKFVAEALGKGEEEAVPRLIWTSVTVQLIMGVVGGLVLFYISPLLVEHVLNIPQDLVGEALSTFYLLAFSVPVVLISSSFRGGLEAAQRFDLINAVQIPTSSLTYLLPFIGILLGFELPGIVILILLVRLGVLASFVVLNIHLTPELKRYSVSFGHIHRLFSFGGWVMVSSIAGPILQYFDRFIIGSLLTMSAVAYYTVPQDILIRLWIISGSLAMTLFPAFSALGVEHIEKIKKYFVYASKYTLLILGPIILFLIVFANDILEFWLGNDFAQNSTLPLQILAIGILIGSISQHCFSIFQGIGRPDIGAKIYFLLIPMSFMLTWFLISKIGISGAALSWTLSRLLGLLLSLIMVKHVLCMDFADLDTEGILHQFACFLALGALLMPFQFLSSGLIKICLILSIFILFIIVEWLYVMDAKDKRLILSMLIWKHHEK